MALRGLQYSILMSTILLMPRMGVPMDRLTLETAPMTGNPGTKQSKRMIYEDALEAASDSLLNAESRNSVYPAYTERQLSRHGEKFMLCSADTMAAMIEDPRPSQTALDELKFLMSVTDLSRRERICLHAWILGWTQTELSGHWEILARKVSQQSVSRWLRDALLKCYDSSGISFYIFSKHSLYRTPLKRREIARMRTCPYCHEHYAYGLSAGQYCSTSCFDASQHEFRSRVGL